MKKDPIKVIPLEQIQLNEGQLDWLPRNPRTWTQTDIDRTKRSLDEDPDFMQERPILAIPGPEKNTFVAFCGNLRLTAARALGWPGAPVVVYRPEWISKEDRDTIIRRAIKDNGSFGSWDTDELASWPVETFELEDWGVPEWITGGAGSAQQQGSGASGSAGAGSATEDDFDENKDGILVRCKKGDIWELGDHRLMCGDSIDLQQVTTLMGGVKCDMVLTDPPYGTTAISWDKPIDLDAFFKCVYQNSKENAAISVFGAQPFVTDLINASRKTFRYEIIWEKTMKSMFLSVNKCPLRTHENIVVFYKKQPVFNPQKYEVEERPRVRYVDANRSKHYHIAGENTYTNDGTRFYGDVLHFSSWNGALFGNNENATKHPTQKPVELIAHLEKMYTNPDDTILDLFGGSGTTLIAAEQLGRKCYMMEIDPHYCDVILASWEKLTGKTANKLT